MEGTGVFVCVGKAVEVPVIVGVAVVVAVTETIVTVAPVTGIPVKRTLWPLLPAAPVALNG